jgi:hypothetical protein
LPQFWHAMPLLPQALWRVPGTQRAPEQHPKQFEGPHAVETHVPAEHVSPSDVQFWQGVPPSPQSASRLPPRHIEPEQHPAQVEGEQACVTQTPPMHDEPIAQGWHMAPPCPQAVSEAPDMHMPFEQQPTAHVMGSQTPPLVLVELAVLEGDACAPPPPFAPLFVELEPAGAPPWAPDELATVEPAPFALERLPPCPLPPWPREN